MKNSLAISSFSHQNKNCWYRREKAEMWKHWNLNFADGEGALMTLPVEGNMLVLSVRPCACRKVNFSYI